MTHAYFYVTQGLRIIASSIKNRIRPKEYKGSTREICIQIVDECFNGRFFQTSTTNFPQFWTRDFGWCTFSLLKLGHHKKVHQTLRYAINRFKQYNEVTTTITPSGRPFDFPLPAVDSLPWLIHSIRLSKFPYYEQRAFYNAQIKKFFRSFIDKQTGLVKENLHVSSMKDFAVRNSSCYDNSMAAMLANDVSMLKLDNPFSKFDYKKILIDNFWQGEYFYDDLSHKEYVAGDANVFPFLCGGITDTEIMRKALNSIMEAGLSEPYPLKYTKDREGIKFIFQELFMRDYESDACWMHMGPLFVKLLKEVDAKKADEYTKRYTKLIKEHKNYLEVLDKSGKPFWSPLYYCDRGMLWAANYLTLE